MKIYSPILLLFFCTWIQNKSYSQCPDSIHLSRQSQVDSFSILFPDCIVVNDLVVMGDDITHLAGLLGIKAGKSIEIMHNPILTSLAGLDSLRGVEYLFFYENSNLQSFHNLGSLTGLLANLESLQITGLKILRD